MFRYAASMLRNGANSGKSHFFRSGNSTVAAASTVAALVCFHATTSNIENNLENGSILSSSAAASLLSSSYSASSFSPSSVALCEKAATKCSDCKKKNCICNKKSEAAAIMEFLKDISDRVGKLEQQQNQQQSPQKQPEVVPGTGPHSAFLRRPSLAAGGSAADAEQNPTVTPQKFYGIDVVLGAQWGDEGKGKLVDILSQRYDVCCRVAGGSNAGHTIVVEGVKYKFHLLPSGVLHKQTVCVIGNGVVVHLPAFLNELDGLTATGVDYEGRVLVSDRAHVVFDFHQEVDGFQETKLGRHKIGTTKKGIGPAYASKIQRNGLRVGDLQDWPYFERRFRELADHHIRAYPGLEIDVEGQLAYYKTIVPRVKELTVDTIAYTNRAFYQGKKILVEGANATMLDIDFGTYPFVTSSNPSVGSVMTGLGVSPRKLRGIYGTVKAYCTRVGEGPFPTELSLESGEGLHLSQLGAEYGTTTGRPRRCGWLDIPQMKYSALINGFTSINLTKVDVLTGLSEIKLGKAYYNRRTKQYLDMMPANLTTLEDVQVEYETLPGWTEDISHCKNFEDLPANCQTYILRVQELLGIPIRWIGVGPNRNDVVDRGEGWDLVTMEEGDMKVVATSPNDDADEQAASA